MRLIIPPPVAGGIVNAAFLRAFLFLPQFVGRGLPLDKSSGMGIIVNRRGRCDKRSAPELVNDFNGLYSPQKPSPARVAVFAFQSLDSYRDRMTQNMNRKHEKHTVPPPFEEVTNRLTMYAASLGRVYTAGGFLSNSGGRTWASPLRGNGFPRQ